MNDVACKNLHAGTPMVNAMFRTLSFLRTHTWEPARVLSTRMSVDPISRTSRIFGCRPLVCASTDNSDTLTIKTLTGQDLVINTVDGDTAINLRDAAGRSLWSRSGQGTVSSCMWDLPDRGGNLLMVSESVSGQSRVREHRAYGDAGLKSRNLAGSMTHRWHNAGVTETKSVSLSGQPVESLERLLQDCTILPDWPDSRVKLEEKGLLVSTTYDSTGEVVCQINAAKVATSTARSVTGATLHVALGFVDAGQSVTFDALCDAEYCADGRARRQSAGNGLVEQWEYEMRTQRLSRHITTAPDGRVLADLRYAYDPSGNITMLEDAVTDASWHRNAEADGKRRYAYDTLYRLTVAKGRQRVEKAWRRGPRPVLATNDASGRVWTYFEEAYSYDDGNNLIKTIRNSGVGGNGWTRSMSVSARSNRSVTISNGTLPRNDPHDAFYAGGLLRALEDGRTLRWYADGTLSGVSPAVPDNENSVAETYSYADIDTRIQKQLSIKLHACERKKITTYAGGAEWRRLFTQGTPSVDEAIITSSGGLRLVRLQQGNKVEWLARWSWGDHQGSVSGETDENGQNTAREEYSPFGASLGSDDEAIELCKRSQRYSAKELDATGLYYYGWRYYQPEKGCWISADPGGLIDGVNLFRFCANNPVTFRDKDGLVKDNETVTSRLDVNASILSDVIVSRYKNETTHHGEKAMEVSSPEPYKEVKNTVSELVERGVTPVFMMIDMQKLKGEKKGIKSLFKARSTVRTNPGTKERHVDILKFVKDNKFPVIDVNYIYSAFKTRPSGAEVIKFANENRTVSHLRKLIDTTNENWRILKNTDGLAQSNVSVSEGEKTQIVNHERLISYDQFLEKYPNNPVVLMGQLEDVCVLAIASDLLTTGRSLVVSQDLIVDINHENNISGITTDDRGRWRYLASQAGSSGFKGGLTFFTKKRAA